MRKSKKFRGLLTAKIQIQASWTSKNAYPGLEPMHHQIREFDLDQTWDEAFRTHFGLILHPSRYYIRRSKDSGPVKLHGMEAKIKKLVNEFKKVRSVFKVFIVQRTYQIEYNNLENNMQQDASGHTMDEYVDEEEDEQEEFEEHVESVNTRNYNDQPIRENRQETSCNNSNGHFVEGNRANIISQQHQYKQLIEERFNSKFTNGQLLRINDGIKKLKKEEKMMKFAMHSPLLVSFMRELFEV